MKLSKAEKIDRKRMLSALPMGSEFSNCGPMVALWVPTCRGNGMVTWAICSENDTFNRKRGEFECLTRYLDGIELPMPCEGWLFSEDFGANRYTPKPLLK